MEKQFVFLFINLILSFLVGSLGKNRNIGFGWSFALSFLLSPLIGLIITLFSKKKDIDFIDA